MVSASTVWFLAVVIFIVINFLQVVILPIPGIIAVGTGVALFGAFKCAVFSLIGILIGSIVAFYIGRILGYKVVSWLVGKETIDKWLNNIKNKSGGIFILTASCLAFILSFISICIF